MIQLNYRDARPIYEQVKDGFRHLIIQGVMEKDEKLPSVRELATSLTINPNTIQGMCIPFREGGASWQVCRRWMAGERTNYWIPLIKQ